MLISHGIWDQVRVDRGNEFALILFVQKLMAAYRTNTFREPYRQTPSTQVRFCTECMLQIFQVAYI